jgi:HD-GYP domain-containing protein (c-di-GMP phosphodiesterase class II)
MDDRLVTINTRGMAQRGGTWSYLGPDAQELVEAARTRAEQGSAGRVARARATVALFVGVAAAAFAVIPSDRELSWVLLVLLVGGYALASRVQYEVGAGVAVPTELVLIPMLFLLPAPLVPAAVAAAIVLAQGPELIRGRISVDSFFAAVGSAGFVFAPAALMLALGEPDASPGHWALLPLVLLAQFAGDLVWTAGCEWLALGISPRQIAGPMLTVFAVDALLAPLGLTVAFAAQHAHVAVLFPLTGLLLLHRFARDRAAAITGSIELGHAYRGTAFLLGDVIEADDHETGTHSRAVAPLTIAVATRLGLGTRDLRIAELVALLHDVGKIRIPNEIIHKPGPLSPDERAIVEMHTIDGEQMLGTVGGLLGEVGRLVRSCHERWDGTGYPDGLEGEEIPLISRIVYCCDALHAMTSDRPYRDALTVAAALDELERCAGTQFDPEVVEAVVSVLAAEAAADRRASAALDHIFR